MQAVAQFACPARCGAPGANITADDGAAHLFFENLLTVVFPNIGLSSELITKFTKKLAVWKMSNDPKYGCEFVAGKFFHCIYTFLLHDFGLCE